MPSTSGQSTALTAGRRVTCCPTSTGSRTTLAFGDRPWHGRGGPIPVYRAPKERWGPVDLALAEAALALGHPWCEDLNAPDAEGVTPYAINSRDGVRVSTNDGYLEPARGRANLEILGDTPVDRVLLEDGRAVGVRARTPKAGRSCGRARWSSRPARSIRRRS